MELCIDSILLSASAKAFDKIPLNNNSSGHCGAGTITLNCENFTDIPKLFNYENLETSDPTTSIKLL
jgi:hypothetical protein